MACSGAQEAEKKNKSPDFNTDNIQESMISPIDRRLNIPVYGGGSSGSIE